MPRRSAVFSQILRYSVRYAPLAYEGIQRTRGPAREFAQRQVSRRNARVIAFEHAAHLVDGSVLPVYDGDTRVWVVFSGDEVVGTHPVVRTSVEALLAHYDLGKRVRPGQAAAAAPRSVSRLGARPERSLRLMRRWPARRTPPAEGTG